MPHLALYLKSSDMKVRHSTVMALHQLSKESNNCVIMHSEGVVKVSRRIVLKIILGVDNEQNHHVKKEAWHRTSFNHV